MIQETFDKTMMLLRAQGGAFPFLAGFLLIYDSTLLVFSFYRGPAIGNSKENVLALYELEAIYRNRNGAGKYEKVLDRLRGTVYPNICVSVFITEIGTYTMFSDFEREDLIGALFSPDAPEDVPQFSHLFANGQLLSRERE
jgi:hypothetical protein